MQKEICFTIDSDVYEKLTTSRNSQEQILDFRLTIAMPS